MKPYTAKMRIYDELLDEINKTVCHYFSEEEWDAVSYAVSQAVDKAFDAGMREQRKKQAVHKKMYEMLNR